MAESIERQILTGIAVARLNERYYKHLAQTASRWDLGFRITTVLASCGAVASTLQATLPHAWQVLSLIAALASVLSPILKFPDTMKARAALAAQWSDVRAQLEDAALLPEGDTTKPQSFAIVHSRLGKLHGLDPDPDNDPLAANIWGKVMVQLKDRYDTTY